MVFQASYIIYEYHKNLHFKILWNEDDQPINFQILR
jgi:hypothetical protein